MISHLNYETQSELRKLWILTDINFEVSLSGAYIAIISLLMTCLKTKCLDCGGEGLGVAELCSTRDKSQISKPFPRRQGYNMACGVYLLRRCGGLRRQGVDKHGSGRREKLDQCWCWCLHSWSWCVVCRAPFASLFTQQSVNRININNMNELLIYSVIPNMYLYAIVWREEIEKTDSPPSSFLTLSG